MTFQIWVKKTMKLGLNIENSNPFWLSQTEGPLILGFTVWVCAPSRLPRRRKNRVAWAGTRSR
jgi:hypothetical protein